VPSVTGVTLELAQQIEAASVVDAFLSPSGDLILVMAGGTQINAGPIADNFSNMSQSIVTLGTIGYAWDVVVPVWHTGSANVALTPFDVLPTGAVQALSWSQDMGYLAVAMVNAPGIHIYKRSGDTFTKLANPATLPAGPSTTGLSWSRSTQYLAVFSINTPRIQLYKRATDTFTKLADPVDIPAGWGGGCAFSPPDGTYLALSYNTVPAPYHIVYKRVGDVLTKLTTPTAIDNVCPCVIWSNSGQYLIFGGAGATRLWVYKRAGDTFTYLTSSVFSALPPGVVNDLAISPDDQYLVVLHQTVSPGLSIYKRSGDTFTKLPNPATSPPGGSATSASFSPDGKYLVVTSGNSPYLIVYKRSGDTFTTVTPLPAALIGNLNKSSFSPDGVYLVCGGGQTPYICCNKSALGSLTDPATRPILVP
jgi:Tol biopolymer transport system component